jgi:hypothetical protein
MKSPGEGGSVVVHLGSAGHAAGGTRVKHTTKLRVVDHGQRKARERVVWAVRAIPGIFHAHVWVKTGREKQVKATSRTVRKLLV